MRPATTSRIHATSISLIIRSGFQRRYRQVYSVYTRELDMSGEGILIFERKHMLALMLYLLRRGGSATRMEVYVDVANNDRMPDKFAVLEEAGLIVQTRDRFTRAVTLTLTDRGRAFAETLEDLDSSLRDRWTGSFQNVYGAREGIRTLETLR